MTAEQPGGSFVRRLVTFGRVLRDGGLEVGPNRLEDAVNAMAAVEVTSRDDVYWALRCTLCSKHEHLEAFDALFEAFWRQQLGDEARRHEVRPEPVTADDAEAANGVGGRRLELEAPAHDAPEAGRAEHGQGSSTAERLLDVDFREYGPQELRDARRVVARIARALPRRRSFRLEPARDGRHLEMRRTMRDAMRTGGHPVRRAWRRNRLMPRRTVFLLDISGSMAPYARPMVMFAQAAVAAGRSVEAFTFGTRLTRLTSQLGGADPDRALTEAARAVPDWAGGTRIGASIKAFNDDWGRRGRSRGALVIVVSDGWERGDPDLLRREMAALHRAAHTLVWVNPLAGDPRYRPVVRGMVAALPSIDVFLPGHNLRALTDLATVLEMLGDGAGRRRRHAAPPARVPT